MKTPWTVSTLAVALVLLVSHSALAQVASAPPDASYHSRLGAPPRPGSAAPQASEPALELRLTSRYAVAKELVRSLVRVAPHPDNRFLRVTVDSLNYYSSSDIQLEGAFAVKNHFFAWKSLPPGVYDVVVTVFGPDGPRSQRRAPFEVTGVSRDGQ